MLKSGCNVESVYFDNSERILRSIAINLIVAWRLLLIGLIGCKLPDLPPDIMFDTDMLKVLRGYARSNGFPPPNTLSAALFLVGMFGGASTNRSYPFPGYMSIMNGLSKLAIHKYCLEMSRIADQLEGAS